MHAMMLGAPREAFDASSCGLGAAACSVRGRDGGAGRRPRHLRRHGGDAGDHGLQPADLRREIAGRELAVVYRNRCIGWNQKRDPDRALADCDEAIRLDPNYAGGHNGRCWALNSKGEHDRAMADCNQAIRLDPKASGPLINRGIAWAGKRDFDRAIADFDQAIRLNPKDPNAYVQSRERVVQQARLRPRDRRLRPGDPPRRRRMRAPSTAAGCCGRTSATTTRAIADYSDAIRLDPEIRRRLQQPRPRASRYTGDHDRALADLDEAIRLDPKYAFAYNNRGLVWTDKRDFDRAVARFQPGHPPRSGLSRLPITNRAWRTSARAIACGRGPTSRPRWPCRRNTTTANGRTTRRASGSRRSPRRQHLPPRPSASTGGAVAAAPRSRGATAPAGKPGQPRRRVSRVALVIAQCRLSRRRPAAHASRATMRACSQAS